MKRTQLALSLLCAPALFADSFESQQSALAAQQSAVDAAEKRVSDIQAQIDMGAGQLKSMAGKPENAGEIDRMNSENRRLVEECNRAVEACKAENKRLQEVVSSCTGGDREVVTEGGRYALRPHERKEAPVARTSPSTATTVEVAPQPSSRVSRAPYANNGHNYKRASSSHLTMAAE